MSRIVLNAILTEIGFWLNTAETEQLYNELLACFGLIGALNECEALEKAWQDPYNKREIEEFIRAWLRRRRERQREEATAGVV
ncbi:MAG: hypothetical protein ACUVTE_06740 [Candidatus Bathycorpusculaceae bacterium]